MSAIRQRTMALGNENQQNNAPFEAEFPKNL
jgi:hypothetical protein